MAKVYPRTMAKGSAGTASLPSRGTRRLSLVSDPYTAKERVCSKTLPRGSLGIARLQAKGMRVRNMPSGICITTGRDFPGTIAQRYGGYMRQPTTGPQMRSSFFDLSIKGRLQPKRSTIPFFSLLLAGDCSSCWVSYVREGALRVHYPRSRLGWSAYATPA